MSKFKKILLVLCGLILITIIVVPLFTISELPGPSDLKKTLNKKPQSSAETKTSTTNTAAEIKTESSASQTNETTEVKETKQLDSSEKAIMTFLEEDINDIRVCDNLGASSVFDKKSGGLNFSFDDLFKDTERQDPMLESFRFPLKAIFQDEKVSSLLKEVINLDTKSMQQDEKDSLLDKIGFYSRAAMTMTHLYSRKAEFETMGDRSIHMSVLSKLAILKPEVMNDGELRSLCDEMERTAVTSNREEIKTERAKLMELIEKSGLTPKELGFNPESFVKFKVNYSKNGISFSLDSKDPN